jgi:integrase
MKEMKTKHAPYSLYKKRVGERYFWYARFWNPQERKYTAHRATGVEVGGMKERRSEAERAANAMLAEVCFSAEHMNLVRYLEGFWDMESPYFRELAGVRQKKVSNHYVWSARGVIRLHIAPYPPFSSIRLDGLTAGTLRDFMLWLNGRGVSGSRINRVIQAIRIPLRYAASRDEVRYDPFTKVRPAAEKRKERGVLTREEVAALVGSPVKDARRRLAVLLGTLCGMRLGEVRGLCWEDIEGGVIRIRHNWQDMDGLKGPKLDSFRDVPLPAPVSAVLESYRAECGGPRSGLVFSRDKDSRPLCHGYFGIMLRRELEESAGITGLWTSRKEKPESHVNEQAERNITFHALRHTFVSLARLAGINDFQVQAMAGHRSSQMMDRYSHPNLVVELDGCKKRLENLVGAV